MAFKDNKFKATEINPKEKNLSSRTMNYNHVSSLRIPDDTSWPKKIERRSRDNIVNNAKAPYLVSFNLRKAQQNQTGSLIPQSTFSNITSSSNSYSNNNNNNVNSFHTINKFRSTAAPQENSSYTSINSHNQSHEKTEKKEIIDKFDHENREKDDTINNQNEKDCQLNVFEKDQAKFSKSNESETSDKIDFAEYPQNKKNNQQTDNRENDSKLITDNNVTISSNDDNNIDSRKNSKMQLEATNEGSSTMQNKSIKGVELQGSNSSDSDAAGFSAASSRRNAGLRQALPRKRLPPTMRDQLSSSEIGEPTTAHRDRFENCCRRSLKPSHCLCSGVRCDRLSANSRKCVHHHSEPQLRRKRNRNSRCYGRELGVQKVASDSKLSHDFQDFCPDPSVLCTNAHLYPLIGRKPMTLKNITAITTNYPFIPLLHMAKNSSNYRNEMSKDNQSDAGKELESKFVHNDYAKSSTLPQTSNVVETQGSKQARKGYITLKKAVFFSFAIYALIISLPIIYDYFFYEEVYDNYDDLSYVDFALEYVISSFQEAFGSVFSFIRTMFFQSRTCRKCSNVN